MTKKARARVVVSGLVQGVGYRFFVLRHGRSLGLGGYVRNAPNGSVELEVEGESVAVEQLLSLLKDGPTAARVDDVRVEWADFRGEFRGFEVIL